MKLVLLASIFAILAASIEAKDHAQTQKLTITDLVKTDSRVRVNHCFSFIGDLIDGGSEFCTPGEPSEECSDWYWNTLGLDLYLCFCEALSSGWEDDEVGKPNCENVEEMHWREAIEETIPYYNNVIALCDLDHPSFPVGEECEQAVEEFLAKFMEVVCDFFALMAFGIYPPECRIPAV